MPKVITFGTFDLFHVGHLRLLNRARTLGTELMVGISTDQFTLEKKGFLPLFPLCDRMEIIRALSCVDFVFAEESMEKKACYIKDYAADILVMGHDWKGHFDYLSSSCKVVYLERTPDISSTLVKERVKFGL